MATSGKKPKVTLKAPAFEREYQAKLLRCMFQFPDEARDIIVRIDPGIAFENASYQWIARKLKWAFETHRIGATSTMLAHELMKESRLNIVPKELQSSHAKALKRLIKRVKDKTYILENAHTFIKDCMYREALVDLSDGYQAGKNDYAIINQKLDEIRKFGDHKDGGTGVRLFRDFKDILAQRKASKVKGVPSGFGVDHKLRAGGWAPRQLSLFIAPTGRGKTATLTFCGRTAIRKGKSVLHISLEMEVNMIAERYMASFSKTQLSELDKRLDIIEAKFKAVAKKTGSEVNLSYYPEHSFSCDDLRDLLRRLESDGFYPDLIILDYADIMNIRPYMRGRDSTYEALGYLYQDLRSIAGEYNVPILTATQSNRNGESDEDLGVIDISDSYRKAQTADVIIAINQKAEEKKRKLARFTFLKNRNGPVGGEGCQVKFDTGRVQISDV